MIIQILEKYTRKIECGRGIIGHGSRCKARASIRSIDQTGFSFLSNHQYARSLRVARVKAKKILLSLPTERLVTHSV